jgi:patatin-like phospholipase/acyl hydrolase
MMPGADRSIVSPLVGGGIRGLSSLYVLQELMSRLQVAGDLPEIPLPCDYFDLIVGTSTGVS